MTFPHNDGIKLPSSGHYFLEIVHFKPKQNAIANGLGWVAKRTMMMIRVPVV